MLLLYFPAFKIITVSLCDISTVAYSIISNVHSFFYKHGFMFDPTVFDKCTLPFCAVDK